MEEKIIEIYEEFGQIHEVGCELNLEGGSFDGCTCAVKPMVKEIVVLLTEFFSHDITFDGEEQRKSAVKMYLESFGFKDSS